MLKTSLWKETAPGAMSYRALEGEHSADVVVIGAGITGLTTAYELLQEGRSVIVIEAQEVGGGTTGFSSCHLTTDIGVTYQEIKSKHGEEIMTLVAQSRRSAIDYMEELCKSESIECDFRRVSGFLYADRKEDVKEVEHEYTQTSAAGLDVALHEAVEFPGKVFKALEHKNQAAFNAQAYVNGLAAVVHGHDKGTVFEKSRVTDIDIHTKTVTTLGGKVRAREIVLATHLPIRLDMLQTMAAPYRSYIVVAEVERMEVPDALYWDCQDPYHYTRYYQQGDALYLIVGGEDHKTGHSEQNLDAYANLRRYVEERFQIKRFVYEWSSQYYEPADGLPYIGLSPLKNIYVGTGYSGDGLVYSTIAALIISDMIAGRENPWLKAYDARRFTPLSSARKWLKENLEVAADFVRDHFTADKDLDAIPVNEGRVVKIGGERLAVYRSPRDELYACSAVCPHMGCIVHWNDNEKTWDCPCHGSRFTSEGQVITGPAVTDLAPKQV